VKIVHYGNVWRGYGGTEETVRTLLRRMNERGHDCKAVTWKVTIQRDNMRAPEEPGVQETYAETEAEAEQNLLSMVDDETVVYTVLLSNNKLWKTLRDRGVSVVHEYNMPRMGWPDVPGVNFVFNSRYTKSWYPNCDGPVIFPLIDYSKFDVKTKAPGFNGTIGLINPCIVKGAKIFKKLALQHPEHQFLSCGGWCHKTDTDRKLKLPAFDNTRYAGNIERISDFYNKVDILLVPTQDKHDESFGRVLIEGMYHGCAVIASYKDAIPEAAGCGAHLVGNYGDWKHWDMALKRVIDNINLYKSLGDTRTREIDWNRETDHWERVFMGALDGTGV